MGVSQTAHAARIRRKRRNRWIAAAFFLFIAIVVMMESPLTRVRKYVVVGNRSIPASRILKDASLRVGISLWQVNPNYVNSQVRSKETLVSSVAVSTDYLKGIVTLRLALKQVVAMLEVSGRFYRLLDDGDVYGTVSDSSGYSWPIITSALVSTVVDGRQTTDPNVTQLCRMLPQISPSLLSQISEFHLDAYGVVTTYLNNRFEVRLKLSGFKSHLVAALDAVNYFVKQGYVPGVIDVTGGQPYQYMPLSQSTKAGN